MALPKAGQQVSFADLQRHFGITGPVSLDNPKIKTAMRRNGVVTPLSVADLSNAPPYRIPASLRFNDAKLQYLYRTTPGTSWAGNNSLAPNPYKYTFSAWVKQLTFVSNNYFMGAYNAAGNYDEFGFTVTGNLDLYSYVSSAFRFRIVTTQAWPLNQWNHVVFAYDVSNADANERIKLWVNGVRITSFSTNTVPSQNNNGYMNNAGATIYQYIGIYGSTPYANMRIAEHIMLDNQAVGPETFGEFNNRGKWVPKEITLPASAFGFGGWRLNFAKPGTITSLMTTAHTGESPGDGRRLIANQWQMQAYNSNDTSIASTVDIPSYGGQFTAN